MRRSFSSEQEAKVTETIDLARVQLIQRFIGNVLKRRYDESDVRKKGYYKAIVESYQAL